MNARTSTTVLPLVAALTLSGCTYRSYGEPPETAYVELSAAPVAVAPYPYTYYGGRPVYFVNDRWMYNDHGRWVYYRQEPTYLYRQRGYVQQAPRAYPGRAPYSPYAPSPGRQGAPPAVRVQ